MDSRLTHSLSLFFLVCQSVFCSEKLVYCPFESITKENFGGLLYHGGGKQSNRHLTIDKKKYSILGFQYLYSCGFQSNEIVSFNRIGKFKKGCKMAFHLQNKKAKSQNAVWDCFCWQKSSKEGRFFQCGSLELANLKAKALEKKHKKTKKSLPLK